MQPAPEVAKVEIDFELLKKDMTYKRSLRKFEYSSHPLLQLDRKGNDLLTVYMMNSSLTKETLHYLVGVVNPDCYKQLFAPFENW